MLFIIKWWNSAIRTFPAHTQLCLFCLTLVFKMKCVLHKRSVCFIFWLWIIHPCVSLCSLDVFGFSALILSALLAIFSIKFFNFSWIFRNRTWTKNKSGRRGLYYCCSKNVELEHLLSKAVVLKHNVIVYLKDYLQRCLAPALLDFIQN